MGRVTVKGLLAHKLRFALTALAVILGVAFMSGTMVLTDTISRTFDNLFADVNKGTDAYVRSAQSLSSGFGGAARRQRGRIPASLLPEIESVPGAKEAAGNLQFYAQLVDKKGDAIGNPQQGAPTFGFNWGTVKALNPYRLEPGGHAPQGNQVVIDAASAKDAGFKVGDPITILTQGPPGQYEISGIAKFGDVDSAAGSTAALFDTPTAQAITGAADQFDSIAVVADPGVSQQTLRNRIADKLDNKAVPGSDWRADHEGEPERHQERAAVLQRRAAGVRADRVVRRYVHHLQHVLDRGRATAARDGAAARDRCQRTSGSGIGPDRGGARRVVRLGDRPRSRDRPVERD